MDPERKPRFAPWLTDLAMGIAFGLVGALAVAVLSVVRERYLEQGLQRLVLAELRDSVLVVTPVILLATLALPHLWRQIERLSLVCSRVLHGSPAVWRCVWILGVPIVAAVLFVIVRPAEAEEALRWTRLGRLITRYERPTQLLIAGAGLVAFLAALWLLARILLRPDLTAPFRSLRLRHRLVRSSAALLVLGVGALELVWWTSARRPDGPNVLLITIDTLRADHLSCYGHARRTSPRMDELARQGLLFENAYAQASWTLPSMASMHSGLYPSQHGAVDLRRRLPQRCVTLAERLQNAGYATLAVVSHIFVGEKYGFSQGFDRFDESVVRNHAAVTSPEITEAALRLVEDAREPFFLWVHYFDPHFWYVDHEEYDYGGGYDDPLGIRVLSCEVTDELALLEPEDVQYVRDIYDEEISYTDAQVGALWDSIGSLDLERGTLLFLTSDHGEEFMERGMIGHKGKLYQELIHVPLIVSGALDEDLRGRVVEPNVELVGIAPSILELCGIDAPFPSRGLAIGTGSVELDPSSYSEGTRAGAGLLPLRSVVYGRWKLIQRSGPGGSELYDLSEDPGETRNLIHEERTEHAAVMRSMLAAIRAKTEPSSASSSEVHLTEEELERLRALGYADAP